MRIVKRVVLSLSAVALIAIFGIVVLLVSRIERLPEGVLPTNAELMDPRFEAAGEFALTELTRAQGSRHFPSLSLAVGVDGEIVWAGAVGYADVRALTPATPRTRYHIASVSKALTTAALGKLLIQGEIDLETPFRELVPDYPEKAYEFTIGQLQTHSAGIRHHTSLFHVLNQNDYRSVREAATGVERDPLLYEPGTRNSYSTPGYTLLALAMERAAAKPYLLLMEDLVFSPLSMADTFADTKDRPAERVATPYVLAGDVALRAPPFNNSDKWAGGGFLSTPSDMVRFGNALLEGPFLPEEWRSVVLREVSRDEASRYFPAMLLEDETYSEGARLTSGGTGWGGRASLQIYVDKGVVIAYATNTRPLDNTGPGIDFDRIADAFVAAN
jgi:serine beta-lactamase-like protein LACTB, mitochondrial